jgi:hypothetical protein
MDQPLGTDTVLENFVPCGFTRLHPVLDALRHCILPAGHRAPDRPLAAQRRCTDGTTTWD